MVGYSSLALGFICLLAFAGTSQAKCLDNCDIFHNSCLNNTNVESFICQLGMERCVGRCYSNASFPNASYYARDCFEVMNYCKYMSN